MISAYAPVLKSPSAASPTWYKHFHSVFYLSQLTNQIFASYLESGIDSEKDDMIRVLEPELIRSKIIRKNSETGSFDILKKDTLKSLHIEDVIDQIIEKVFIPNQEQTGIYLLAMGLEQKAIENKEITVNRNLLLKSTTSKNWYELLGGLLNVWEFIFLYGSIESTFKEILSKHGQVREEGLIDGVFNKFKDLSEKCKLKKEDVEKIWIFFTELRNVYVHNHGLINKRIKANIGGKLDDLKKAIFSMHSETILITDLDDILKSHRLAEAKFYFLRDPELNIFRNSMIQLIEGLEACEIEAR